MARTKTSRGDLAACLIECPWEIRRTSNAFNFQIIGAKTCLQRMEILRAYVKDFAVSFVKEVSRCWRLHAKHGALHDDGADDGADARHRGTIGGSTTPATCASSYPNMTS
jgi:hypothetical protein